jgi:hypothetical protein
MNSMFVILVVQFFLWLFLFSLIFYLVKKNNDLKKRIESLQSNLKKRNR